MNERLAQIAKNEPADMLEEVKFELRAGTLILYKGAAFTVTDVVELCGLPFIQPEGFRHEIQLPPKTCD